MTSMSSDSDDLLFKALAARPRREILRLLATGAGEGDDRCCGADEVCACVFSERLGLTPPTVSHHMKVLIGAGLVDSTKTGLWVHYRLRPEAFAAAAARLTALAGKAGASGSTCC